MHNFFEDKETNTNPFAPKKNVTVENKDAIKFGRRLNITDMEVLNSNIKDSETEFLEFKMNNLYHIINQYPQTLDPIAFEKAKIEWEELRDKLEKTKKTQSETKTKFVKKETVFEIYKNKILNFLKLAKFYSPKIKNIITTFNEINKEVEDLVSKATPLGEEDIKYGVLVNRIYQASKLNCKITNEIK